MDSRLRVERFPPPKVGIELSTVRSVGQCLTYSATGAPWNHQDNHSFLGASISTEYERLPL